MKTMITFEQLNGPSRNKTEIRHGFMTQNGGISDGLYTSLNCGYGSGDNPDNVTANRTRALEFLGAPDVKLVTAYQEHTATALPVVAPWEPEDAPVADGLVSATPGIAIGILTADCAPVLMADHKAGVIGAAHAGWRGAHGGILENTVQQMAELGADRNRIEAAVGPCIAQASYEVGWEFWVRFHTESLDNDTLFVPATKEGHFMFDLTAYVSRRLHQSGVRNVQQSDADTYSDSNQFFSYRRTVHQGEKQYGRSLSVIVIT